MSTPALHNPHLDGEPFFWQGGKTGVLLLHGLTATPVEIKHLGKSLHKAGFTVHGPLLPGHAQSPAQLNRTRWLEWYATAEAGYRALTQQCETVFVGGESTGALLALLLAARCPEVRGVLAYAPALELQMPLWQQMILPLAALFVPSIPKPHIHEDTTWQGYTVNPLRAVAQLQKLQEVVLRELGHVTQPVLIVQGRKDITIRQRSAEIVYQRIHSEAKQLHWLENSDHCLLLDGERHVAARLTIDFLYKYR